MQCKNGALTELILNLNELTLSFIIDSVVHDYGNAFDVDEAVVDMLGTNDLILLLK